MYLWQIALLGLCRFYLTDEECKSCPLAGAEVDLDRVFI